MKEPLAVGSRIIVRSLSRPWIHGATGHIVEARWRVGNAQYIYEVEFENLINKDIPKSLKTLCNPHHRSESSPVLCPVHVDLIHLLSEPIPVASHDTLKQIIKERL